MFIIVRKHKTLPAFVHAALEIVIHPTYIKAQTEAEHLARHYQNEIFFVMAAVAEVAAETVPVRVKPIEPL